MNTSRDTPTITTGIRTPSLLTSTQQQQFQQQQQQQINQQEQHNHHHHFHHLHHHQNQKFNHQPVISQQPPPLSYLAANPSGLSLENSHCKINSTATTIELEQPCGLTTFLSSGMSCRGRAEAFARRLQSRLRTLGQDSDVPQTGIEITEQTDNSTWMNGQNGNVVTDLQPLRLSANETADSYFDFDLEPESPGSPIDECEYTRLIETTATTPQECAPESGFVCASPCSTQESGDASHASASSGSDGQFFDPEMSENEANQSNTSAEYFDCQQEPAKVSPHILYQNKNLMPFSISPSTTGSTSSSSSTSKLNGHLKMFDNDSCSDSLPPSQSTEFTNSSSNLTLSKSSNSNSTLQDTDVNVDADSEIVPSEEDVAEDIVEEDEKDTLTKYCTSKTKFIKYDEADDEDEEDEEEDEVEEQEHTSIAQETEEDESKEEDTHQITAEALTEAEPNSTEENSSATCNNDSEVIEITETEDTKTKEQMSDEEEYERPQRVRRCSSLKTGKTPPGTPGRKKIVRFADVLGLDLADVRTFLDEVPKVPKSAFEDLEITSAHAQPIQLGPPLDKVLVPMFQQPGALPAFLDKVREKQVCLENAAVTDPISLTITGSVRVRNLDFHKSVHVRYSLDNWRSYSDLTANYVENSCDGFSDKFTFILFGNSLQIGQRIEMAIRFQAKGEQFWDNNYGANYCFQCLPCNTMRSTAVDEPPTVIRPAQTTRSIDLPHQEWSNAFLY